jgi:hypothetical protein
MPNAQLSFILLWKRVVAALSLVAAALLASMAATPGGGSGVVGSRAGHAGAAVASAPSALIASLDGVVDDREQAFPPEHSGGAKSKPVGVVATWRVPPEPRPVALSLSPDASEHPRHHAARSGLTRAPPRA